MGCDLSLGMLAAARPHLLVNADAVALPFSDGAFDVALAPHMLYHVRDRSTAVRELRRTLAGTGVCVAVTNGRAHLTSLRSLIETAMQDSAPGWQMLDPATEEFSLENGAAQLKVAFGSVSCVRPTNAGQVVISDAWIAADYVASVADLYQGQVGRQWSDVVADVRREVQRVIDRDGAFITAGDVGAFVCR